MRKKADKLNPKTMLLEEQIVLVCPRCGQEEILSPKRLDSYIRVNVVMAAKKGRKGQETVKTTPYDDICTDCANSLMAWMEGP